MGKDAENTLFVGKNQAAAEQQDISGLKGEQSNRSNSSDSQVEQLKSSDHQLNEASHIHRGELGDHDMGIAHEMDQGSGLELKQPAGGLHGDKWQDVHDGAQFKGAPRSAQLMQDPNAGGMHGDKWQDVSTSEREHGDASFSSETVLRPHSEQHRSAAATLSTFKADGISEEHFTTEGVNFHDGRTSDVRSESALHENQILQPALHANRNLEDNTLRDATIYDGRSRPLVSGAGALDHLPLAERVVAGVHAGDPLSSSTLKKSSIEKIKDKPLKDKKLKKDKKLEQSSFGQDAHLRSDQSLIPHEHLKKNQSLLSEEHLAGGASLDKQEHFDASEGHVLKDKHFTNDVHLNKDVNIVDAGAVKALHGDAAGLERDSQLARDAQFAKDASHAKESQMREAQLHSQDAFLVTEDRTHLEKQDSGKKSGLRDKLRSKKDKLKEKLGMKKEEHSTAAETHSEAQTTGSKGHEIATIKIPGIESGDRAAQEMVNHQAKAKKELNAELKEHVHADHVVPSEISGLGHNMAQMNLHENRAVDSQLPMQSQHAADQITRDQVSAKSELNAELKNHVGEIGSTSHVIPSEISGNFHQDNQFAKDSHFSRDTGAVKDQQFYKQEGSEAMEKDSILAKKDLNAEIKKAAGHGIFHSSDHILPSDVAHKHGDEQLDSSFKHQHLEGQNLAGLSGTNDTLMQDHMHAKRDVNAEIQKAAGHGLFGATDHIQPSDVAHKQGFSDMIKEKVNAVKDQFHPANTNPRHLEAEQLAGLNPSNDLLMQDNMHAKKDVNAEIKKAAGHGIFGTTDHILPSAVAPHATHEARHLEAGELAGLSGTEDASNISAKKDVNVEIQKAGHGIFGATDHIQPSDVAHKPGFGEKIMNAAFAVKDQFFQSPAKVEARHLEAEKLAGLSGAEDVLSKDAKKDVNADIKKAAGHGIFGATDHILPSATATNYPRRSSKEFAGEQLAGISGVDNANILAKKDVNAEIQKAGQGLFYSADHIAPSAVAADYPRRSSKHFEGDQLAGLSGSEDSMNILAKKDVNAEIKKAAGHGLFGAADHIQPSDVALHPPKDAKKEVNAEIQKAAGHGLFGASDHILPSDVAPKQPLGEAMKEKAAIAGTTLKDRATTVGAIVSEKAAIAGEVIRAKAAIAATSAKDQGHAMKERAAIAADSVRDRFQPAPAAASLEGERLAGLSGSHDAVIDDNILAKKEVNAEIREHSALGSDHILPSDISPAAAPGGITVIHDGRSDNLGSERLKSELDYEQAKGSVAEVHTQSMAEMIKAKVTNVAMAGVNAVKGQFQAATTRDVSEQDFPSEFQKADFEKELVVGAVKDSDMTDDIMKDSILAKKDVNAEIKEHAPALGDHILPSDIANAAPVEESGRLSMTEILKEKATNAVTAVKETLQNFH